MIEYIVRVTDDYGDYGATHKVTVERHDESSLTVRTLEGYYDASMPAAIAAMDLLHTAMTDRAYDWPASAGE